MECEFKFIQQSRNVQKQSLELGTIERGSGSHK